MDLVVVHAVVLRCYLRASYHEADQKRVLIAKDRPLH